MSDSQQPLNIHAAHSRDAKKRKAARLYIQKSREKNMEKKRKWERDYYASWTQERKDARKQQIMERAKQKRIEIRKAWEQEHPNIPWRNRKKKLRKGDCKACGRRLFAPFRIKTMLIGQYEVPMYSRLQIGKALHRTERTVILWEKRGFFPPPPYKLGEFNYWTYDQVAAWSNALYRFDTRTNINFEAAGVRKEVEKWMKTLDAAHLNTANYVRKPDSDRYVLAPNALKIKPLENMKWSRGTGCCPKCWRPLKVEPKIDRLVVADKYLVRMFTRYSIAWFASISDCTLVLWQRLGIIPRPMYRLTIPKQFERSYKNLYTEDQAMAILRIWWQLQRLPRTDHRRLKTKERAAVEFSKLGPLGIDESEYTIAEGPYLTRVPYPPLLKRRSTRKKKKHADQTET